MITSELYGCSPLHWLFTLNVQHRGCAINPALTGSSPVGTIGSRSQRRGLGIALKNSSICNLTTSFSWAVCSACALNSEQLIHDGILRVDCGGFAVGPQPSCLLVFAALAHAPADWGLLSTYTASQCIMDTTRVCLLYKSGSHSTTWKCWGMLSSL